MPANGRLDLIRRLKVKPNYMFRMQLHGFRNSTQHLSENRDPLPFNFRAAQSIKLTFTVGCLSRHLTCTPVHGTRTHTQLHVLHQLVLADPSCTTAVYSMAGCQKHWGVYLRMLELVSVQCQVIG